MVDGLTASQAAHAVKHRRASVEDLARACLAGIAERDGEVRAWSYLDPQGAIAAARLLDGSVSRGPLHGVSVGIKDIIQTQDMPTQHNSPLYDGSWPRIDAACVSVLRSAGALILGKTHTVEFGAVGRKAPTRNPRDLSRSPGGSSSGSAAAVADGHAPVAIGTQTGGSILRPAAYCGIFGFKPTWGLVSREGVKPFAPSLDTVGWFAREAADLALLFDVFDPHGAPSCGFDLRGARIGLCQSPSWPQAEPSVQALWAAAPGRLEAVGARPVPVDLPEACDNLLRAHRVMMRMEGRSAFLAEHRLSPGGLDPQIRELVERSDGLSPADLAWAYDAAAAARPVFDRLAADYDAILTPSSVGEAPVGLAETGSFAFNALWTLLHAPAINVPAGRGPEGLPLGLTVVGPRFADRSVLAAAAALAPVFAGA